MRKRKPRPFGGLGFSSCVAATLATCSFGSFERIDFGFGGHHGRGHVGCQVAIALLPFSGGLGACCAVPTGVQLGGTVAPLARFDDLMAESAVVTTSLGSHEGTFGTFTDGLTNHNNHLIHTYFDTKKSRIRAHPAFYSRITSACPIDKQNGIVKRFNDQARLFIQQGHCESSPGNRKRRSTVVSTFRQKPLGKIGLPTKS